LNESKFIADPDNPQRKIYLSGDLGRFTGDGQLVFMGRKDFRVKIRGFNVDPPLVENVLMQVGAVRRAVVAARADPSGEKRLVAYILPQPGAELTVEMLRTVMAGKLADYMLPSFIVFMQQIPLLASGKVNSRALPDPAWDNPVLSSAYQPPRNQLEYRLAQLWRQILGVRQVGITDDFFELGGHSLQVVRLCAEIKTYFGKNISPAELIGCNTVACLAERLAEGNTPGEKNLLIPLQSGGTRPPLFVVPGIYGDVFYYLNLSAHLGSDQPVFGIQFYDSDGSLPADLVAMAAIFVEKIRAACPAGPYRLLGHSFGGHLAFAIAHNLAAGGEKVEFLGLLDTSFPTPLPAVTRGDRAREHLKNVLAQPPLNRPGYALGRLNARLLLLLKKASARLKAEKKPWGPDDVYTRNALALRNYAHPYYPGKICVFRVRDAQTQDYHPLISNWSNLAAEVEFYDAPGGHGNMLDEPYAAGLAELIQNALDGIG